MLSEDVMMGDGGGDARLAREGHVGGGCSGLAHTSCGCPGERATAAKSMEEQIRLINSNQALSMSDKARAIQMLYNQAWMRPRGGDTCVEQPSRHALPRGEFSASERAPCYTDSSRETLGCEHYPRKCKLEAAAAGDCTVAAFAMTKRKITKSTDLPLRGCGAWCVRRSNRQKSPVRGAECSLLLIFAERVDFTMTPPARKSTTVTSVAFAGSEKGSVLTTCIVTSVTRVLLLSLWIGITAWSAH
eukprot:CAMPEP_0185843930 /NCGR_PEP_ID=MMETSP1354-20130828/284_1 /TAXON_ID=708628 /ORGANISM="Erythrolobus madagascarensis, Strain CCMP3276" /LENGTH=244 /DNA_ID=CAMNT_0028543519 /DNA_START=784 /DNA_END=1519 /DNA_ORIENTATION=+